MNRRVISVICPRAYSLPSGGTTSLLVRLYCSQAPRSRNTKTVTEITDTTQLKWVELGKEIGRKTVCQIRTTVNVLWEKYEEFVGLNEVRNAQLNVTEAEKAFMVARGVVRQSRETLEGQQAKLKEVRDKLDRVSREDSQYLELATQEHKLLQEERRHRTTHENAEELERETFALFSAAVRSSHEKERTRAERTKNWSIVGSVLGAVIGVLGSTYINHVRLQELRGLLLEAQKGPVSLQEALKEQAAIHQLQNQELNQLVTSLKELASEEMAEQQAGREGTARQPSEASLSTAPLLAAVREQASSAQETSSSLRGLQLQVHGLEHVLGTLGSDLTVVKKATQTRLAERAMAAESHPGPPTLAPEELLMGLEEVERRLESHINTNTVYSTVLTYTAFALTLPVIYVLFRGS
uniref:Coiled-coil domain-containing protein 51 n=1 Tax=Callorhinchus milii TaxID=7868 RepID=V9KTR2_CALMI